MFNGNTKTKSKNTPRAAESASAEIAGPQSPADGLPLFFARPAAINPERHGKAGIGTLQNASFASKTNSIPLTAAEFMEAAKHYPIVFSSGEAIIPLAIVGLEQENYFINADGAWKEGAYVPAYVRKYPFVFMEESGSDRLTLCVEESAPQFADPAREGDVRLFDKNEPTEFTRNALAFCAAVQEQHALTRQFCQTLKTHDLLSPQRSDVKLATGREMRLEGFQLIDSEKLRQLPDETVAELHRQGTLPLIYYAVLSTSNWQRLVELAAARERQH